MCLCVRGVCGGGGGWECDGWVGEGVGVGVWVGEWVWVYVSVGRG